MAEEGVKFCRVKEYVEGNRFKFCNTMGDAYSALLIELDKSIERTKKHIEKGSKGSPLEPRRYDKELEVELSRKRNTIEVFMVLKEEFCKEKTW